MTPQILRLPDGQTFTVSPVFAGVGFSSDQYKKTHHHSSYPVGWTAVVMTESSKEEKTNRNAKANDDADDDGDDEPQFQPFTKPSLSKDSIFISSVANPSVTEYKPAASPTRHMAMMLWVTLCWYFHQPEPTKTSDEEEEWIVHIRPQGLLRGGNILSKLEHMGLIAARDSSVARGGGDGREGGDDDMFVHRRMFWQTPARIFLFTPEPILSPSPSSSYSPPPPPPLSPFTSTSHLPTYYPPAPLPHIITNSIRHPLRPRPPRMGDVFYSRFIPSVGQYLSFRVASSSPLPVPYSGPIGPGPSPPIDPSSPQLSDTFLLQAWHAIPRVSEFWGPFQPDYLPCLLSDGHSFPAIGLWDGVPFGYFELYWAKEDLLGRHAPDDVADWDRGIHVMIGEDWARGRVAAWLTSLVHWCFMADLRTMTVCLEPRVDNDRMLHHLQALGFTKEKIVTLPHKQSWYVTLRRESWQGPSL
ncbi:hypothetical protein CP533_2791 [Ophiocordyceps camponoti-saundersi (nom. inval.)]|nr:hypothetical protein CP533_2791 [Ophiocordyceps camponoti-saundersi (nom. inval.)]